VTAVISRHGFSRLDDAPCRQCIGMHTSAVSLVQVRDVPEATLRALKAPAAERGLTLSGYLRGGTGATVPPSPTPLPRSARPARRRDRHRGVGDRDALVDAPADPELLAVVVANSELHAPALVDYQVASALRGHVLGGKLAEPRLHEATEDFGTCVSSDTRCRPW
jgi:hypothetical protein